MIFSVSLWLVAFVCLSDLNLLKGFCACNEGYHEETNKFASSCSLCLFAGMSDPGSFQTRDHDLSLLSDRFRD